MGGGVNAKAAILRARPKANGDVVALIPIRNTLTLTKNVDVMECERAAFLDVSWTITGCSSTADDESSYKDGTFFLTEAPLQVEAFGCLLCEIPVDASFEGYEVAIEDAGDSRTFRLARSANSVCRMRRASSSPFIDTDVQSLL